MNYDKFDGVRSVFCLYNPWDKFETKRPIRKVEYMID